MQQHAALYYMFQDFTRTSSANVDSCAWEALYLPLAAEGDVHGLCSDSLI